MTKSLPGVLMGDSICEGAKGEFQKTATAKGIPGQTSNQVRARWQKDVLSLKPKWVILSAGINDLAQSTNEGLNHAILQVKANLEAMAKSADVAGIKLLVLTLPPYRLKNIPPNKDGPHFLAVQEVNEWIKHELTKKYPIRIFDYYHFVEEKTKDPKQAPLLFKDPIHPSPRGYALLKTDIEREQRSLFDPTHTNRSGPGESQSSH